MERAPAIHFYRRWVAVAFEGALDRTALVAFLALSAVEVGKRFLPGVEAMLSSWVWAVPFWALAAVMVFRVFAAPLKVWRESQSARSVLEGESADRAARIGVLEQEVRALQNPPPPARHPDGIFQHGREVGRVTAAVMRLHESEILFGDIAAGGEFDPDREFEYRDWVLTILHADATAHADMAGAVSQRLQGVQCDVIRAR